MHAVAEIAAITGLDFHHLGVACADIDVEARTWQLLGYVPAGAKHEDPLQGVVLQFFEGGGPRLELIAPLPGSTTLEPYLRGGSRLYHTGHVAADFDAALQALAPRGRIISPPKPAAAFGGARVAFVLLRNLLLVELIESSAS